MLGKMENSYKEEKQMNKKDQINNWIIKIG